jgi:hypothetical protein
VHGKADRMNQDMMVFLGLSFRKLDWLEWELLHFFSDLLVPSVCMCVFVCGVCVYLCMVCACVYACMIIHCFQFLGIFNITITFLSVLIWWFKNICIFNWAFIKPLG